MLNNLDKFLNVFENLIKSEIGSKKIIQETLEEVLKIKIDSSKIEIREFNLYIETHPVIKNEIKINYEEILQKLENRTGKNFDSIS